MTIKPGLYLTDNGACYCREHLGTTALHTGRDISGQEIEHISDGDSYTYDGVTFGCETCAVRVRATA